MDPISSLPFNVALTDRENLVDGLTRQLREAIVNGRLAANTALPPSRQFAIQLNVSRNTVLSAYERLISQGFLYSRRGAGTYVSPSVSSSEAKGNSHTIPARANLVKHWKHRRMSDMALAQPLSKIDFRIGYPETRYFPFSEWQRCLIKAQRQEAKVLSNDTIPQGFEPLRIAITTMLSGNRAIACQNDEIIITHGTQHSLAIIAAILIQDGITRIAMESPGYPMAKHLFEAAGARVVDVPVDDDGICVDQIPDNIDCIYITPSHQFPMGMSLTPERRAALLSIANERGIVILEDDYDSEIHLSYAPMDALKTMDTHNCVFYLGTFSKVMFPDIRTGFILAPPWAKEALLAVRFLHSWQNPVVTQRALAEFIGAGHLRRHISAMTRRYRLRHELLSKAMQKHTTLFRAIPVRAGVHATYLVAPTICAIALSDEAAREGIGVRAVAQFTKSGALKSGLAPNALAFGLGCVNNEDIDAAVDALADIARRLLIK